MTSPESIVVDLAHARMLKEAGWPQYESVFVWESEGNNCKLILSSGCALRATSPFCYYAAPSAEEILRRLPGSISQKNEIYLLEMSHSREPWCVSFVTHTDFTLDPPRPHWLNTERADTLANAASQMYAYLANNGLLPTEA